MASMAPRPCCQSHLGHQWQHLHIAVAAPSDSDSEREGPFTWHAVVPPASTLSPFLWLCC